MKHAFYVIPESYGKDAIEDGDVIYSNDEVIAVEEYVYKNIIDYSDGGRFISRIFAGGLITLWEVFVDYDPVATAYKVLNNDNQ